MATSGVPPSPEAAAALGAGRRALFVALLGGLAVVLVSLVSLAPLGTALGALALVLAVRALTKASKARTGSGSAVTAIAVASVVLVLGGLVSVGQLLLAEELARFEECSKGANTRQAQATCDRRLRQDLEDRIGIDLG